MANVRQQDTGSSAIISRTAEIEREKAARAAQIAAEQARKKEAQAEAERKAAKAKADAAAAEAARRKAEANAKQKQAEQTAKIDQKKVASSPAKTSTATKTSTAAKTTTKTTTDNKKVVEKKDGKGTGTPASETTVDLAETLADTIPDGGNYSYTPFTPIEAVLPKLSDYSAEALAKLYGIDYNQENIYNTLMKGVDTAYKTKYTDQGVAENKYYDNMAAAQSTLADQRRLEQSQAIMAGTNKGMQAAQALSAMLGVSQQAAAEATQLAVDRQKLSDAYGADQAKARADALNTYNAIGADFLEGGKSLYSSDVSRYVGQLDSRASTETANASLAAQAMAGKSAWDTELANSLSGVYGQYMNNASNESIANTNAAANKYIAEQNYDATKYATDNQQAYTGYTNPAATQTASTNLDAGAFVGSMSRGEFDYTSGTNYLDGMLAAGKVDAATKNALQTWLESKYGTKPKTTPNLTVPSNGGIPGIGFNPTGEYNPLK